MKTLHYSIITIVGIMIIILVYPPNVYAPCAIGPNGTQLCAGPPPIHMTVKSDSMAYAGDDKITISGTVDQYVLSNYGTHLSVKIYDPKMTLYRSDQFNAAPNGSFVYSFKMGEENVTSGYYNFYLSPDLNTMSYGSAFMYQATPYDLEMNGTHYFLVYALVDGAIDKINTNIMEKSITIHVVNTTSHSMLKIKLPRDLIDSKSDQGDTSFTVLADNTPETQYMQSVNFNETQTSSDTRTLLIDLPFHPYTTDGNWYVKIIGTSMNPEKKNPPVIITQVELDSPFVFLPDAQTCFDKPGFASAYTCSTDIIPGHKVQCGYFIGSKTCEPIHLNPHFVNSCTIATGFYVNGTAMKDTSHEFGEQWASLYNRLDRPITVSQFEIFPYKDWEATYEGPTLPYHVANPPSISPYLVLGPHQSCTYGFYAIDDPMSLNTKSTTLTAVYQYNGTQYSSQTLPLTDNYNDSKTWQYDGNKWVFAEQNTVKVPEFGALAIPVFLIGTMSVVIFYRIQFRK